MASLTCLLRSFAGGPSKPSYVRARHKLTTSPSCGMLEHTYFLPILTCSRTSFRIIHVMKRSTSYMQSRRHRSYRLNQRLVNVCMRWPAANLAKQVFLKRMDDLSIDTAVQAQLAHVEQSGYCCSQPAGRSKSAYATASTSQWKAQFNIVVAIVYS